MKKEGRWQSEHDTSPVKEKSSNKEVFNIDEIREKALEMYDRIHSFGRDRQVAEKEHNKLIESYTQQGVLARVIYEGYSTYLDDMEDELIDSDVRIGYEIAHTANEVTYDPAIESVLNEKETRLVHGAKDAQFIYDEDANDVIGIGRYTSGDSVHYRSVEAELELYAVNVKDPEILKHYPKLCDRHVLFVFEKELGIRFDELTIREQLQVFNVLHRLNAEQYETLKSITEIHGISGLRIFIACEKGQITFNELIQFIQKVSKSLLKQVVNLYEKSAVIADQLAEDTITEVVQGRGKSDITKEQLYELYIQRAHEGLKKIIQRNSESVLDDRVIRVTNEIESDTVLFTSVFKALFKGRSKEVKFEDLKGIFMESIPISELSEKDRQTMIDIAKENWAQVPSMYKTVMDDVPKRLESTVGEARIDVLRKNGEIVAFVRFENIDESTVYAGSLNVDPAYRDSAIGEAFLDKALERETTGGKEVVATVHPLLPTGTSYVERFECVITGTKILDNGEWLFDLSRDPYLDPQATKLDTTYLMTLADRGAPDVHGIQVISFTVPEDITKKKSLIDSLLNKGPLGHVATRYFHAPYDRNRRYLAIEPRREKMIEDQEWSVAAE